MCLCAVDFGSLSSSEWKVANLTAERSVRDIPAVRHLEVSNHFWVKMRSWLPGDVGIALPFDEILFVMRGALAVQDTVREIYVTSLD